MSNYPGRIITKAPVTISTTQASGVWTLHQAMQAIKSGIWPGIGSTVITSFTASGYWTAPAGVTQVDYLVVAGGGAGGSNYAGGGGAGGFRTGTALTVVPGTTYAVAVGAGGAGAVFGISSSTNGGVSTFSSIVSAGGGGGGTRGYGGGIGGNGGSGVVIVRYLKA